MQQTKKGFTLIELLVVIAIIGILSAIGLVSLNGARERARDAQRKSDLAQIRTALALYYDDNNAYPAAGTVPDTGVATGGLAGLAPTYIGAIPKPPAGSTYTSLVYGTGTTMKTLIYTALEAKNPAVNYWVNHAGQTGEISATPTCTVSVCPI